MHHSGGAAAETELIYGQVLRRCFEEIENPHILSVGLGLGYVELTAAREALLRQNLNFTMESFELVPELRSCFQAWLQEGDLPTEIQRTYDHVARAVLQEFEIELRVLKTLLADKLRAHEWLLQGPLMDNSALMKAAHGLIFDAFSAKTNPELWNEEFLVAFFKRATAADSLISTYACRAGLKRALGQAEFSVQVREGFQGKRHSTLGQKGLFIEV